MRPLSPSARRVRRWRLAVPLALSAIALTACSGGSTTSAESAPEAAVSSTSEPATPAALDFTGTTVAGTAFDAAALAGTPVIMWFWAPWCTICRAEAPDVSAVAKEFEGRVAFLGIAGRGPLEDMQAFVEETSTAEITHVADVDGRLWSQFDVIAQPSFVFVTPSGEVQAFTGGLDAAALRDVANQLLAL